MSHYCKMVTRKDGTVPSTYFKSMGDAGAYLDHSVAAAEFCVREFAEASPAPMPNQRMETYVAHTNKIPRQRDVRDWQQTRQPRVWALAVHTLA